MPKAVQERGLVKTDAAELARILRVLRSQGKTVAVADGVFDVLHSGHVLALQDAATRANYLVLAVHSDASVQRRLGEGRPVRDEIDRCETVAALKGVHYVTVVDGDTVQESLRLLRPNFLVRGHNRKDTNEERKALSDLGSSRITVGSKATKSTTAMIDRIRSGTAASPATAKRAKGAKSAARKAMGRKPDAEAAEAKDAPVPAPRASKPAKPAKSARPTKAPAETKASTASKAPMGTKTSARSRGAARAKARPQTKAGTSAAPRAKGARAARS